MGSYIDALERYERETIIVIASILLGLFRTSEYANLVILYENSDDNLHRAIVDPLSTLLKQEQGSKRSIQAGGDQ